MQIRVLSAATPVFDKKSNVATNPMVSRQNETSGYAPVTANLWGEKKADNKVSYAYGAYIPNFGAARPTNNPADLPAIEADTQSGFRLSTLEHAVICPDCGRPVMTKPIFANIKEELNNANESSYLNVIQNHEEFLYPQEEKILKHISKIQEENPDLTVRQIVQNEREHRLNKLEDQQFKVLDKISELQKFYLMKIDQELQD
jgi:hypothetical protein